MTFETREESLEDGQPIELFEFDVGAEVFRFTSAEDDIQALGFLFTGVPMGRTQPKVNQDEPGSSVIVTLATDHPDVQLFARSWVSQAPNVGDVRVKVWRHHKLDTDFQLFWIGYMVSANYENNGSTTSMNCKSLDNAFTLQGPRKNWGTLCNHQLYGTECRLSQLDFSQNGTIDALAADGVTYTLSGISAPTVRHEGGMIEKTGTLVSAMVILVSGSDYTIQYPNSGLVVGDPITLMEGCEHNLTDCQAFPNLAEVSLTNVENYGGSPYTPPINLFVKGGDAL